MLTERIEEGISQLGSEHEPPPGWEGRVIAGCNGPRPVQWFPIVLAVALASAAIASLVLGWR